MWTQIFPELPEDLARVTTSVWVYENYGWVGFMRTSFLAPPMLWFQLKNVTPSVIKVAPELLTELQRTLSAPTVFAETNPAEFKSQRFLRFLGFAERPESYARKLFIRSL